MPQRTQAELIAQAAERDALAFARLIEPMAVRVLVFLRRRGRDVLGGDCDEEDLFQVVLASAWRLLPTFEDRGPGSFHRWLLTLSRRALNDRVKYVNAQGRNHQQRVARATPEPDGDHGPADSATSISVRVSRQEQSATVERALDALTPGARRIIEMHLLEARSLSEIATLVGVTKNAAWERLQRAMTALRRVMEVHP